MRLPLLVTLLLSFGVRPVMAQCTEPHYRWTEKNDESLASLTAVQTTIRAMITTWALLPFTGQAIYKCADRAGRELRTYSLYGWVRRVKTAEDDGDWHIELTSRSDSPIDSCIVAEIPPTELGGNYDQARTDLANLVDWNSSNGDVAQPVRLRFIGAAFFDGEHRGGPTRRDKTDGAHGRCNSSARALWELHPVYWIREPT